MLSKRIIPCMDIRDGKIVKGINFEQIREVGDPVEMGQYYAAQGADELVYLDITATHEKRKILLPLVKEIARNINIPFTVGGGISGMEDVNGLLHSGADKITINSAAVSKPQMITELARNFGSQCIVVAMDIKQTDKNGCWFVYTNGGRTKTELKAQEWARQAEELGAGEILLTSMNHDGTKNGFALEITREISNMLNIPVIASGGAGTMQHFAEVFTQGCADAALAASVFHYGEIKIPELKNHLQKQHIPVRM
ncbi:MAG: imidazole glycerol phosphate synthase subunit HisF [Bacteroidia bacterium]|nr:imidazole glycerol phosphate synthase subunit HisF [Bacteroidia bacterium]